MSEFKERTLLQCMIDNTFIPPKLSGGEETDASEMELVTLLISSLWEFRSFLDGKTATVVFEAFELSPMNKNAINTIGRLRPYFSSTAVSISLSTFADKDLQIAAAAMLMKMSQQTVAEMQPRAKKSGQHHEERDTTNPSIVTQLLIAPLRANGTAIQVAGVWKLLEKKPCTATATRSPGDDHQLGSFSASPCNGTCLANLPMHKNSYELSPPLPRLSSSLGCTFRHNPVITTQPFRSKTSLVKEGTC